MDKRLIIGLCAVIVVVGIIVVCVNTNTTNDNKEQGLMGTVIGDYIIELPEITEIDFDKALKFFEENYGRYNFEAGCTTVGKVTKDGDTLVGRSYDLYYSYSPAFVVHTAIPGHYKTIGICYNGFNGAVTFEKAKKSGLSEKDLYTVYCMSGDVLNEKGFYVEANMRNAQPADTGIKESNGTNPGADLRMSFATLVRYLGENAATVNEALEIANSIDVYGFKTDKISWCGGLFLADATGHYGVLELVDNKLVWNDMQQAQANFYLSPEYKDKATLGMGFGRYDTVMAGIDAVENEDDMRSLINKVRYLQSNDPDTCAFDPITEHTGAVIDGKTYYIKDMFDPINREILAELMREKAQKIKTMSVDELRADGTTWLAAYQTIVNCNERTLTVQFFEDGRLTYHFSLDDEKEA